MVTASNKTNSEKDDKKGRSTSPNGHASDDTEKEGGNYKLIINTFSLD